MLDFTWSGAALPAGGITRRNFLRVGGLTTLGLSLSQLLEAEATEGKPRGRAKSVILVFLGGGLSHHDSFDLKPDAVEEIRGKYQSIETNVPGLHIGELLPKMAQAMDKVCLVRSGAHNNDHHETATNWVLSGRFGTPFGDWPAMGAVAAHEFGFEGTVPPYVAIPRNPSFTWELGKSHSPRPMSRTPSSVRLVSIPENISSREMVAPWRFLTAAALWRNSSLDTDSSRKNTLHPFNSFPPSPTIANRTTRTTVYRPSRHHYGISPLPRVVGSCIDMPRG